MTGLGRSFNLVLSQYLRLRTPKTVKRASSHSTFALALVITLAVLFTLPGLIAHGPWKPDEPYMFGLIDSMLKTGDWVVPTLAGEPFMEKPPLFVWVAAMTSQLASPWLDIEYGARLAIGVFILITFVSTASAARRWWGPGYGRYAVLALLATVGLQQHGRMMIPDLPLLAGFAVAFCGWASMQERPIKGGILFGTGIGMSLMAKGLLGPGVLILSALLLPLLFRSWRTHSYALGLLVATTSSLPWILIWPIALYARSPTLFEDWFWTNNIGRFAGFSVPALGAAHESGHLIQTIPWFTFPALPLALWALWLFWRRRQVAGINTLDSVQPAIQVSLVTLAVLCVVLGASASGRVVYLLPMLIPLAIISAPAITMLPDWFSRVSDWTARVIFGTAAATCWIVWLCFFVATEPLLLPILAKHLPMDFQFHVDPIGAALALFLMTGWIFITNYLSQVAARATISWVSGLVLVWGTAFALLLPWIDAAKSYQSTFTALAESLGENTSCVASVGLGESERAMLTYIADVEPQRRELQRGAECDVLLWQGVASDSPHGLDTNEWQLKWEGARPGERRERFWLFTRNHIHSPSVAKNSVGLPVLINPVGKMR